VDITSVALLAMFGSAFVGGLIGLVVGKLTRFEVGLIVGLLVFGGTTLAYAWKCFDEYRSFTTAGANALWGEVIKIIDKPSNESGSITSPAPVIRFAAPDGTTYVIEGPTASSAKVGEHINVIFDPARPEHSRVGIISDLRGGAIALLLFGTFPVSFAVLQIASLIEAARSSRLGAPGAARRKDRRAHEDTVRSSARRAGSRNRFRDASAKILFAALFCSIVWIGMDGAPLVDRFVQGFAGVTASLVGYALWGAYAVRLGLAWTVGLLMLALNFGVWAFALHLLR